MQTSSPEISVFNRQRKIPLDVRALRGFAALLGSRLCPQRGFTIRLVSDASIRGANRRWAGRDRATDVLSFPEAAGGDERGDPGYAGDILISVETADRQKGGTLLEELQILSLHGLLHLLGHDHEKDQGEMSGLELRLRKEFGLR